MAAPMDDRQKRAVIAVVSIFVGGIALIVLLIVISSGGDDTKSVNTAADRTTTSSTSTTTTTLPATTTTFAPITVPPTAAPTPPPTVIVIPPTSPPTSPPTAPASTTSSPSTTSTSTTTTTTQPPEIVDLQNALEIILNGGVAPDPGTPPRVAVDSEPGIRVRVTWALDPALDDAAQKVAARQEAFDILGAIQAAALSGSDKIVLRATLPDPDTGQPHRVVRLVFERATLDAIDFTTLDPQEIFLQADEKDIDPSLQGTPTTTTTT